MNLAWTLQSQSFPVSVVSRWMGAMSRHGEWAVTSGTTTFFFLIFFQSTWHKPVPLSQAQSLPVFLFLFLGGWVHVKARRVGRPKRHYELTLTLPPVRVWMWSRVRAIICLWVYVSFVTRWMGAMSRPGEWAVTSGTKPFFFLFCISTPPGIDLFFFLKPTPFSFFCVVSRWVGACQDPESGPLPAELRVNPDFAAWQSVNVKQSQSSNLCMGFVCCV